MPVVLWRHQSKGLSLFDLLIKTSEGKSYNMFIIYFNIVAKRISWKNKLRNKMAVGALKTSDMFVGIWRAHA